MTFTSIETVYDLPRYCVRSYGNGTAYEMIDKATANSMFFQGDDALKFEREIELAVSADPDKLYDLIFEVIWNAHEFGE